MFIPYLLSCFTPVFDISGFTPVVFDISGFTHVVLDISCFTSIVFDISGFKHIFWSVIVCVAMGCAAIFLYRFRRRIEILKIL